MSIDKIAEVLRKCEVFSGLSDKELSSIAELCEIEEFNAGELIYSQGSIGTKLYILSEGQVYLERTMEIGDKRKANVPVFIQRESASRRLMGCWSELIGEQHMQMCTARSYKPSTVVSIPCSKLREIVSEDLALKVKILEKLVLFLRDRIDSSYETMETL